MTAIITLTIDQFTAALKYLGWQGGTVYQVMEQVETFYAPKPIPDRRFDWRAAFRGQDEGLDGWGTTREEAIANLFTEIEEAAA